MDKDEIYYEIGESVELAAELLPKGYSIVLEIENGGYDVQLKTPKGLFFRLDGEKMSDDIADLIEFAVNHLNTNKE